MTSRMTGLLLLCAIFAVVVGSASANGLRDQSTAASPDPDPNAPTLTAEEALLDDAEEYAKLHGVSLEDARRQLDLQLNVIPQFETAVASGEASRFGGLAILNQPNYRVVVYLTSGRVADLARYISDDRLNGVVEVRHVARTYAQLKAAQIRALQLRSVVAFDADIDLRSNQVRLYVAAKGGQELAAKAGALRAAAAGSGAPLPDWVVVHGADSMSHPDLDIFGGLNLSDTCTSGFSVTGSGGSGGVTTAAHCPNSLSYAGNALTFKAERYEQSFDVQWHSKTNTNFPAKIYRGQGVYGAISGKKARWNQPIGATVCKRGITTDRTCGTIATKDYAPSYIPNVEPTFITATYGSAGGDSGGPVFVGEEAWGTHSGGAANGNAIYMASNYIETSMNLYIRGT
jgi:streptogrisin C